MKKPVFGIIGGNGPIASAHLHLEIMHEAARHYRAHQDADFPSLVLTSLGVPEFAADAFISKPLEEFITPALKYFEDNDLTHLVVSCNTLHAWFSQMQEIVMSRLPDVQMINLVEVTTSSAEVGKNTMILTSNTSRKEDIYGKEIISQDKGKSLYPVFQEHVTTLIDHSMKNTYNNITHDALKNLVQECWNSDINSVILGCTELHVYYDKIQTMVSTLNSINSAQRNIRIIDCLAELSTYICKENYREIFQ